jgi:tetratricopeptide (TPR) repeat protein
MRVLAKAGLVGLLVFAASVVPARAQSTDSPQDAAARGGQTDEAAQANALYSSQNLVGALPLYEDLHKRHPREVLWDERLALCLLGAAHTHPDAEAAAMRERAHQLLLEAKAGGDNSNLMQVLLEKLESPVQAGPTSPGLDAFQRAEKAFSTGDLPGALKLYEESAAADPKFYEAPLEAGDTEFKRGNYAEAGTWFARAIAINPTRETAYRYWGDSSMKAGDPKQAEGKYIDAIVAEPYARTPRVGLKQWADLTKSQLAAPPVTLPARPNITTKDKDGFITSMTVGIDPAVMAANKDSPMLPAIMAYEMGSTMWVSGMFHKTYPAETRYRHSLGEEAQSIRVGLSALAKANLPSEKMDTTWRTLLEIEKDGMLECWILLDHPDQGIAQDYVSYRAEHRDLLHAYTAKYDVHPR